MKQNIQVIKQGGRMAVKVRQGTGREEEGSEGHPGHIGVKHT